jgi:hypothetical protein
MKCAGIFQNGFPPGLAGPPHAGKDVKTGGPKREVLRQEIWAVYLKGERSRARWRGPVKEKA